MPKFKEGQRIYVAERSGAQFNLSPFIVKVAYPETLGIGTVYGTRLSDNRDYEVDCSLCFETANDAKYHLIDEANRLIRELEELKRQVAEGNYD